MSQPRLKIIGSIVGAALLAALIMYTGGFLATGRIAPGVEAGPPDAAAPTHKAQALERTWPEIYEAVGTVRPRTETTVESQVRAQVREVLVRPGTQVTAGEPLVVLDEKELSTRLGQATQDLNAARAALTLAEREYGRRSRLFATGSAPKQEVDRAKEVLERARAAHERALNQVEEARIARGYARVNAPESGVVIKRLVEPGDLALPGRPLIVMEARGGARLEAYVYEGLINQVSVGQKVTVKVPALAEPLAGRVDEIVPSADPLTRTFLVKVTLPNAEGLYSGMFGRLLIPVGERRVVLAPSQAVSRVGQLEMVLVRGADGRWRRVYVTTGKTADGQTEIMSGLKGGETIGWGEGADAR